MGKNVGGLIRLAIKVFKNNDLADRLDGHPFRHLADFSLSRGILLDAYTNTLATARAGYGNAMLA